MHWKDKAKGGVVAHHVDGLSELNELSGRDPAVVVGVGDRDDRLELRISPAAHDPPARQSGG